MSSNDTILKGWEPVREGTCGRCGNVREVDSMPLCEDCWADYEHEMEEQYEEEMRRAEHEWEERQAFERWRSEGMY
jgi:predicted amidophosphoribosyltransferase